MTQYIRSLGVSLVLIGALGAGEALAYLAIVDGSPINPEDLKTALGSMNEGQKNRFLEDENSRRQLLDQLIRRELLVQAAQKQKLDQTKEYRQALDSFRRQYLASLMADKQTRKKISDKSAKKYYKANKTKFTTDEVRVQHILLKAEAQAKKILKLTKKKNADFQELAVKYSRDPSAKTNRGELGYFIRGKFDPDFTEASFNAKKGSIVGPVKTAFGYHIIKVIDRRTGRSLEFDEVELQVKGALQADLLNEYIQKLRKKAKIVVNQKAIKNFK